MKIGLRLKIGFTMSKKETWSMFKFIVYVHQPQDYHLSGHYQGFARDHYFLFLNQLIV